MSLRYPLAALLVWAAAFVHGQSVVGTWLLESTEFRALDPEREHGLTQETCLWRDLATEGAVLELLQDGTARFPIDRQTLPKRYRLEDDRLLLHIESPMGQASEVHYALERQGNRLILYRSDKLVSERYVFRAR